MAMTIGVEVVLEPTDRCPACFSHAGEDACSASTLTAEIRQWCVGGTQTFLIHEVKTVIKYIH